MMDIAEKYKRDDFLSFLSNCFLYTSAVTPCQIPQISYTSFIVTRWNHYEK
jgi:hypothetical protein